MEVWRGAPPNNVRKDGKYTVRRARSGGYEIQVVVRLNDRDRVLLTNSSHPDLVDMVNEAKFELTGEYGGAFYLNEFKAVLVPDSEGEGTSYFVGTYDPPLDFDFDGLSIGPLPPADLQPGDPWPGPRVGTKYTVIKGGKDVRFEVKNGRIISEVRLSDQVGEGAAHDVARAVYAVKCSGGSFYVNERGAMFAPNLENEPTQYLYVGSLTDYLWFVPPEGYDWP